MIGISRPVHASLATVVLLLACHASRAHASSTLEIIGATTGGNPEAWADSIREVRAFFARHLHDSPR